MFHKIFYGLRIEGEPVPSVVGWSWSSGQQYITSLYALAKIYPDQRGLGPDSMRGAFMEDLKSLCGLTALGVDLPVEIQAFCEGKPVPMQEGAFEVEVEGADVSWIDHTTLASKIDTCIDAVFELEKKIRGRVRSRDNLSILS
jgi:hypothetical protein